VTRVTGVTADDDEVELAVAEKVRDDIGQATVEYLDHVPRDIFKGPWFLNRGTPSLARAEVLEEVHRPSPLPQKRSGMPLPATSWAQARFSFRHELAGGIIRFAHPDHAPFLVPHPRGAGEDGVNPGPDVPVKLQSPAHVPADHLFSTVAVQVREDRVALLAVNGE